MKTVTIDFINDSVIENFCSGIQGEHNATQIEIIPPADMPLTLSYRLAFEPGGLSETLFPTDGKILFELPRSITRNDQVAMTLEGYEGENRVYKSKLVYLLFDISVDANSDLDFGGEFISAEIAENTKARHTHDNKEVLDGFSVTEEGQLLHNDKPIEGSSGTGQFVPSVSENGDLSWSNELGLDNPDTVNIKGPKGDKGENGAPGVHLVGNGERPEGTIIEVDFDGDNVGEILPAVTEKDENKILKVVDSAWSLAESKDAEVDKNTKVRHTHDNKEVLDRLGEDEAEALTYKGKIISSKIADLIITQFVDADGNATTTNLDVLYSDMTFQTWAITHLPVIDSEDEDKVLTVKNGIYTLAKLSGDAFEEGLPESGTHGADTVLYENGELVAIAKEYLGETEIKNVKQGMDAMFDVFYAVIDGDISPRLITVERKLNGLDSAVEDLQNEKHTVFIEVTETNGTYSLVGATYEDIHNYINEQKDVILFWRVNGNDSNVRYYTHTAYRSSSGYMSHVFGYHFDVSHESFLVREDGAVVLGGRYTSVATSQYNKHIEEYNAFVASIPETTEADNGKFLTVQNGAYALTTIPSAEGVGF